MDETIGGWRKHQSEELRNLYSSSNIIRINNSRRKRLVGHVAFMGENRNAYKNLVGRPEEQRPLRRPIHIWEDNIVACRSVSK
jgi:hypothetical protein